MQVRSPVNVTIEHDSVHSPAQHLQHYTAVMCNEWQGSLARSHSEPDFNEQIRALPHDIASRGTRRGC